MITPEFLQSCTDEQINKGVAWLGVKSLLDLRSSRNCEIYKAAAKNILLRSISGKDDYCINPDISWSVITGNCISIECDEGEWTASSGVRYDRSYYYPVKCWDFEVSHKNPLRAAMEVYILMSTAK